MAFAMKDLARKMRCQSFRNFYTQTLDNAMMDIESGAFSYNTVLERTVNTMTNSGLRYIDYASGGEQPDRGRRSAGTDDWLRAGAAVHERPDRGCTRHRIL